MNILLQNTPFYYQTTFSNTKRHKHMESEFNDIRLIPVYSPTMPVSSVEKKKDKEILRLRMGAKAHMRIIDIAIRKNYSSVFHPFVLLEDDVSKYRKFPKNIVVPDSADLLYIGISQCSIPVDVYDEYNIFNYGYKTEYSGIVKIYNMLSTHGIMYCSLRACTMMSNALSECIQNGYPWDTIPAMIQRELNAYALELPLVYQDKKMGGQEAVTKFILDAENMCDTKELVENDAVSNVCSSVY